MTTSVFIRTEANPAFKTYAQTRRVHDDGVDYSTPLPAGEEVELLIHSDQYLKIVEFDAVVSDEDEKLDEVDSDEGSGAESGA